MGIQTLATELVQQVLYELGEHRRASHDLCSLRSTCRYLNSIVEPELFSHIIVSVSPDRAHCSAAQLKALASANSPASSYAKSLEIRSLNSNLSYKSYIKGIVADEDSVIGAIKRARKCLSRAITSLTNVKTVSWRILPEDHERAISDVVMALQFLPLLEDFRLECDMVGYCPGIIVPFHLLSDLRRITVKGGCTRFEKSIIHPLAQAIARSPNLSSLEVENGENWRLDTASLGDLFSGEFTGTYLPLKHLSVRHWNVSPDEVTMPHLKSLTSLLLFSHGYRSLDHHRVWRALLTEGIRLIELTADEVSDELLEYIASYSGLHKLHLRRFGLESFAADNPEKFFRCALPVHSSTLRSLILVPGFEGKWCFGEMNAPTILGCQRLNELSITLQWGDYELDTNQENPVDLLLRSTAQLPELRRLQINVAAAIRHRHDTCGSKMMQYRMHVRSLITTSMLAFGPVDPERHLTEVIGPTQVFRSFHDPNRGGELRYSLR